MSKAASCLTDCTLNSVAAVGVYGRVTGPQVSFVWLVAAVLMTLDHIAAWVAPEWFVLRLLGRLQMSLWGFMIGWGFRRSRNVDRYLLRIVLVGLLAEPIYWAVSGGWLNAALSIALGVACAGYRPGWLGCAMLAVVCVLSPGSEWFESASVFVFIVFGDDLVLCYGLMLALFGVVAYESGTWLQLYGVLGLFIPWLGLSVPVRWPKWLKYGYFPLHYGVLRLWQLLS